MDFMTGGILVRTGPALWQNISISGTGERKELRVSESPEVPDWVSKIVAEFALRKGLDADQIVRLLIIQGALAYEKAYREEGFENR